MKTMWWLPRLVIPALAACAGATTMRVAEGEPGEASRVNAAPSPAVAADSAMPDSVSVAPDQPPSSSQGYSEYGNQSVVEIRRIGQWTRTGVGESRRLVIRDANAWAGFWSELGVGDRPAVDFSRDAVIAVAAGQRPSGGYEIAVAQVTERAGALTVEVLEIAPGPNCMTSASLTQPVDVVVVPGVTIKSWSFIEKKEVRGCR